MPFKNSSSASHIGDSEGRAPNTTLTCDGLLRRVAPGVPVMKPACPRHGDHRRVRCRLRLDRSTVWRVLPQGIVNAILMVVGHVCSNQPVEMAFVQRDDVVEQLAPAAAHPALREAVLPGGLDTG